MEHTYIPTCIYSRGLGGNDGRHACVLCMPLITVRILLVWGGGGELKHCTVSTKVM
jgi:hypothetical protein